MPDQMAAHRIEVVDLRAGVRDIDTSGCYERRALVPARHVLAPTHRPALLVDREERAGTGAPTAHIDQSVGRCRR